MADDALPYCVATDLHIEGPTLRLCPLRRHDLISIMHWRNAQLDVLRQSDPLSEADQLRYWQTILLPDAQQRHPKQLLLAILKGELLIGYGGLVHIDWPAGRGEVSFLVSPRLASDTALYADIFKEFLVVLKQVAFGDLGFASLFTETYAIRPYHTAVLEAAGFKRTHEAEEPIIIGGRPVARLFHECSLPDAERQRDRT